MSSAEKVWGLGYYAFQLLALPSLLSWVCRQLSLHPSPALSNFICYGVSGIAVVCIFRRFLLTSLKSAWADRWAFLQAVVLGYVAYLLSSRALDYVLGLLSLRPDNVNDSAILAMLKSDRTITVLCVLLLAPLTEELFYRGLIFRNLWQRSNWLGYALSVAAFAAIHVMGYVGIAAPVTLLLCFVQYIPPGLCLAWTYTKADNIFAPMLVHILVNAAALGLTR